MRYKDQINIKLYSYINGAFVLQAIIDDYQEISFSHNLYEAGDFTITINYNIPNALKFERGMFIQFGNDAYMFGEILRINDAISEDGKGSQIRTITGKDSRYIFKRRIIKNLNNEENWAMTAKGEICLRELIKAQCGSGAEAKRQLPITNTIPGSSNAIGKEYSVAESFSNLYDTLVTIATQSEIGWRIKFDGSLTLECFEGSDLSSQVQFSTDFDSLANGEFTDSAESFANTIYVGGKGTGSDRDIYEGESAIGGNSPSGFDRFEAWDNQSSMTTESEYETEALSMLSQYGQTINVSGQGLAVCPYIFKEQYDIGDTITLAFSGKSAKAQILSVTEHWVWGEYGIEFSFGKPQNDLARQLQLILKQIQKASNKTTTTSSVKYYTIPTDTQMPSADVIYDTIGFIGDVGSGATFQLYLDDEKTGAKTYHVWFKQLAGSGKLTLTTGKAGATNLVMNSGTYVAIIYVDAQGNITMAGATTTDTISTNNNLPASSQGVANALDVPQDAVLHYSFDEIPDYPDGTAIEKFINNFTSVPANWSSVSYGVLTVSNGKLVNTVTGGTTGWIRRYYSSTVSAVLKIKIKATTECTITISYYSDTSSQYEVIATLENVHAGQDYVLTGYIPRINYVLIKAVTPMATDFQLILSEYYVGDGSYTTPVIDNANGQNNSVSASGVTVQGVSGKGVKLYNKTISAGNYNLTDDFSVTIWVKPDNNIGTLIGNIVRKVGHFILRNGASWSGANHLMLYLYQNGTDNHMDVGSLLEPNVWTHIVVTKSGTALNVYRNGGKTFSRTLSQSAIDKNNNIFELGSTDTDRPQAVDDLLIFDRALSEAEVIALYLNKANTPKYYSWADWKLSQI